MKHELVNEQCRDQAEKYSAIGNHIMEMKWYNTAAARTIGHKKSDDYERLAREAAKKAGAAYQRCSYAEDWEAI